MDVNKEENMESTEIILNGNEAIWVMPLTQGDVLGTYSGTFKFRTYLTPLQQLEAGREYRSLLGSFGSQASETEANLSFALVQLKHRVISAPPFWTSTTLDSQYAGNIPDLNIIAIILDKAILAENLYKEKLTKEREEILNRAIARSEQLLKNQNEEQK